MFKYPTAQKTQAEANGNVPESQDPFEEGKRLAYLLREKKSSPREDDLISMEINLFRAAMQGRDDALYLIGSVYEKCCKRYGAWRDVGWQSIGEYYAKAKAMYEMGSMRGEKRSAKALAQWRVYDPVELVENTRWDDLLSDWLGISNDVLELYFYVASGIGSILLCGAILSIGGAILEIVAKEYLWVPLSLGFGCSYLLCAGVMNHLEQCCKVKAKSFIQRGTENLPHFKATWLNIQLPQVSPVVETVERTEVTEPEMEKAEAQKEASSIPDASEVKTSELHERESKFVR